MSDALADELGLTTVVLPNSEQVGAFKMGLGAYLVINANILDYGKSRCSDWLLECLRISPGRLMALGWPPHGILESSSGMWASNS